MDLAMADPKGLVRESYRIEGISLGECRSIFVDWALSLKSGTDVPEALRALIAHYGTEAADHPMTEVLEAGLVAPAQTGRRGGRMARMRGGMEGQA